MRDDEKLLRVKINDLEKKKNQCSEEIDMKQRTIQQLKVTVFVFVYFFRATPAAYEGSQARDQTGATAAGLHHSNTRSVLHLKPALQLTVTLILNPLSEARD